MSYFANKFVVNFLFIQGSFILTIQDTIKLNHFFCNIISLQDYHYVHDFLCVFMMAPCKINYLFVTAIGVEQ